MDDVMEEAQLLRTLADIGTSGILLYFVVTLWQDRKTKEIELKELHEKVLNIVNENTKAQTELKNTIEANTKSTETLTSQIYNIFTKKNALK